MTCCCVTPPPDPPPVGSCCFTEISKSAPKKTGASRQNQSDPLDVLNVGDGVGNLENAIIALQEYLSGDRIDRGYFYDVNGDGFITTIDLLLLINLADFFNRSLRSQGNVCVDNITQAQCFSNVGLSEKTVDGNQTFFRRGRNKFTPNQSCGEQVSCPLVPSLSYNTACGEVDCPGYYCNVETGDCGLRSSIDSSLLGSYPYTLVDNCNECQKQNPGCCCYYWEDPEGKIPDYNNVFYVADDSLCNAGRIFHVNQFITPDAYFVSETDGGFTTDSNGNITCGSISPCNGGDDDDPPVSGWYCLEDFSSGNKFCQFFNRDPKEEGFIDTEVKGGPFQEKSICDENCGGGGGGDDDDPHPPSDQGYICLSMDKNGLSDIVLTNHCNVDPFTIDVSVHRFKYDKTGKAGPVSIEVVALRQNVELLSGTVNFPTPDIVNEEFTQTVPFTLTLPRDFSTGEHPLFVQLRNPTNGAKISSFTCRLEIKVVIPDECPFCCKDDSVIGTNISPCDCFALGGECSNTNDCGTPRDDLGRCCYGPQCYEGCPEDFICEDGITKLECDEKIFSINGISFQTQTNFSKGENCDSDPCYTTTTTTTTPSPCSCAEAGKIDCEENINEDGCIFVYNSSTDSFSLTSNCPDGASCLDYDVDCFRTPALSNGDLFGKPCCCTTPPPASSNCDYCCVDPDGAGSTTLTSAECAALKGVCINSGDLPAYTASSPFGDVAKSYCNTNGCDPITGYLVRYEGSGVHTPNSQSYTISDSGNVHFNLYGGLLHDKSFSWNNLDSGNCPIKVTLKKDGVTVYESPYFGDPSYQAELDAALGSSNPISAWGGGFRSGIFFDEVGTLGVDISSPLDCGEKSTWSYGVTCPWNCINSIVNNRLDESSEFFAPAFERRFSHVINSDGFLNFDIYPNLGYNPNRLFDFDTDTSTFAHIVDKTFIPYRNPYSVNQFKTVMIGEKYRTTGFLNYRDCGIGTNYFYKLEGTPGSLIGSPTLGDLNGFWQIGTPPDVAGDTERGIVEFDVKTKLGHPSHPKTFTIQAPYKWSISNTDSSNNCKPFYEWDLYHTNLNLEWHKPSEVIDFLDFYRASNKGGYEYPQGDCTPANLLLHVKQEGNLCSRRYIPPSGQREGTHCSYDFNDFKIGCITVHSQDIEDHSIPDAFDFKPIYLGGYKHLAMPEVLYLGTSNYQDCSCFSTTCCDGSNLDGDCYTNVSEETCDCKIGNGLYNPSLQEIFDDPCNPIFVDHSSYYTHWNAFFGIQGGRGLNNCDPPPSEVPEISDYTFPISDGFWSYPSCGQIQRICAGEDLSGGGGGL